MQFYVFFIKLTFVHFDFQPLLFQSFLLIKHAIAKAQQFFLHLRLLLLLRKVARIEPLGLLFLEELSFFCDLQVGLLLCFLLPCQLIFSLFLKLFLGFFNIHFVLVNHGFLILFDFLFLLNPFFLLIEEFLLLILQFLSLNAVVLVLLGEPLLVLFLRNGKLLQFAFSFLLEFNLLQLELAFLFSLQPFALGLPGGDLIQKVLSFRLNFLELCFMLASCFLLLSVLFPEKVFKFLEKLEILALLWSWLGRCSGAPKVILFRLNIVLLTNKYTLLLLHDFLHFNFMHAVHLLLPYFSFSDHFSSLALNFAPHFFDFALMHLITFLLPSLSLLEEFVPLASDGFHVSSAGACLLLCPGILLRLEARTLALNLHKLVRDRRGLLCRVI